MSPPLLRMEDIVGLAMFLGTMTVIIYILYKLVTLFFRFICWIFASLFGSEDGSNKNRSYVRDRPTATYTSSTIGGFQLVEESLARRVWSGRSLQSILEDIVDNDISVSQTEEKEIITISSKIASILRSRLQYRCQQVNIPEFRFPEEPELIGSSSDGTRIRGRGDCDYLLQIQLPYSSSCNLSDQGEGYWNIQVNSPTRWMERLTKKDGSYRCLSPLEIHAFLIGKVQNIIDERDGVANVIGVSRIVQVSHQAGPAIKLKVYWSKGVFDMDFVPCFSINGKQLVGKRHPSQGHDHDQTRESREELDRLRWRQSFSTTERDHIKGLSKNKKEVYQLVKYLRYHQPQFRQFNGFIYKTAFLYVLDDGMGWSRSSLADDFMNYMKKLEEFFNCGEMNHYYLWKREWTRRNLLKPDYSTYAITEFYNFLSRNNRKGQNEWAGLLESVRQC